LSPALTREGVLEALDGVRDPCLSAAGLDLSIVDLGLVGEVRVDGKSVNVEVTFTEPGCMFTHRIIANIEEMVTEAGAEAVEVTPRWSPIWTEERMTRRGARAFGEIRNRYGEIISPSYLQRTASRMDRAVATFPSGEAEKG
jgi:metal-sulfur cluster biosynthetic enzyme